jgi:tetratricopeptide (TPR) repeat protein
VSDVFFDRFRTAIARLPAGLIRAMPPATDDDLARAAAALGRPVPEEYASFLRSFDGADLFHETIVLAGVGASAPRRLTDLAQPHSGELVFAEALAGDQFAFDEQGRIIRRDAGAEERVLTGTSFERWLGATIAREQLLFGPDGEYAPDVFEPSGQEVLPRIALRQAERALKIDPGAADAEHDRGLALGRLGRREEAAAAFESAARLDPRSTWSWFDWGRTLLEIGRADKALAAFRGAGALENGATRARLLAWATRAAIAAEDEPAAASLRAEAVACDPALVEGLQRSVREVEDDEPRAEAMALLEAVAPAASRAARVRLPLLEEIRPSETKALASRPPRPDRPRRPSRATRRRSGGSRRGSSR